MIKVIIINGAGTSGKDTFIDLFTEVCTEDGVYSVHRFSSVDEVKHFARLIGWDGVKDDKGRRFLSDIKDALTLYNNAPFEYMKRQVSQVTASEENAFIFFHIREPSEIEKAVKEFDASTLLIKRLSVNSDSFTNHADKNVEAYRYDFCIFNCGTLYDLKEQAYILYNHMK